MMDDRRVHQIPYTLPEVVDPPDRLCFVVRIPNERYHIGAFRGAMQKLASAIFWADDTAHTAKDVAAVWRVVVDEIEACMSAVTDVRQNDEEPCILEKQIDGGAWVEFADLQMCPPRLRRNEGRLQWFDGEGWVDLPDQGDEKEDGTYDPPFPDPPPGEQGNCLVAENIVALLQSQVNEWETALTAGAIALGIVTIITGVLSAFFIPYATPAILGLATTLVGLGASGISAAFTSEVYDRLKCIIFCNAASDGSITVEQYETIIEQVQAESGTAWDLIEIWLTFFGNVGLNRAGNSAGITTGDCDCAECVYIEINYVEGTGPAFVEIGEEFTVTAKNFFDFGGYSRFQIGFSQCVEVQWVSGAVGTRPQDCNDFFWRSATGSPACDGAPADTYYLQCGGTGTINAHMGETHVANFMSSTAAQNGVYVLKVISIYEP